MKLEQNWLLGCYSTQKISWKESFEKWVRIYVNHRNVKVKKFIQEKTQRAQVAHSKQLDIVCVYLSRMIGVVWRAVKIRSVGRVDLHLKGWREKKNMLSFVFQQHKTLLHSGLFTPTKNHPTNIRSTFWITLDLMYCNNSFDHVAEIKHQSCKGLCFQSRGLERASLMPADKTGTQQNKHTMKRDWSRLACLMNNKLESSSVKLTVLYFVCEISTTKRLSSMKGLCFDYLWMDLKMDKLVKHSAYSMLNSCKNSHFRSLSFVRWWWRGEQSAAPACSIHSHQQLSQDASRWGAKRRPALSVLPAGVFWRYSAPQRQRGLWICHPDVKEQTSTWRSEKNRNISMECSLLIYKSHYCKSD